MLAHENSYGLMLNLNRVRAKTIKDITGVSYPAANALLEKFTENGILREATGRHRNRLFRYEDYIGLFN